MEVLNENASVLSNFEVFSLLNDIQTGQNGQKKPGKHQQNLATISYSTLKYLEKTPCKDHSQELIANFMKALGPFNLTKAEKLQLLNLRPCSAVEIQLLIEESEERLTEGQIETLIDIITSHFPGEESAEAGNEEFQEEPMVE